MNFPNTITFFASDEGLTLIAGWARQGLSTPEIAARIGVQPDTLRRWRGQCPAIDAAILRGREWATAAVEGALLRRALGYTVEETTVEDGGATSKTKTSEKHIPGDLSAQMAWLRVHRPEVWGEKAASPRNGMLNEIVEAVKQLD